MMTFLLGGRFLKRYLLVAFWGVAIAATAAPPEDQPLPLVGTAAHGHAYPGATAPFGMVQLSPDTPLQGWDGSSGYHYSDFVIRGFSHTHLSGTGVGCLGDVLLMPSVGEVKLRAGEPGDGYCSRFSHERETATPGYYRVYLENPKVTAELTATARCGFHKYTFPASDAAHVIIDLAHGVGSQPIDTSLKFEGSDTISGYRISEGWGGKRAVYFVLQFSKPFEGLGIEENGHRLAADAREGKGREVKAFVNYKTGEGEAIQVRAGISGVSVEGARKNLAAEIPGWDFDAVKRATVDQWRKMFQAVDIQTFDPHIASTFYANVYLSCVAPTLFNDVDGSYRGMDHEIHNGADFQNYTTFSIWDIYRAEWPLMTILHPERVNDMAKSLLAEYKELGQHSTPIWPLWENETWCMIGYHSVDMLAEAYLDGFRGFDAETAYQAMRDTAMQDRNGLQSYKERGYVASSQGDQAASKTIEYSFDDWCIARMAEALGHTDDAELFYRRSANYRNLFDRTTGFFRGRKASGAWRSPFVANALVGDEYTEADAWQYAFGAQQDVPGMIALYGGEAGFIKKLDQLFTTNSVIQTEIPDISGLIGQYSQGDEQCHHVAYLYDYVGAPFKTQQRIRQIIAAEYGDSPQGECGNVDCGQMSAWYIFSALGFYPMNPVSDVFAIGSPVVTKAVVHVGGTENPDKTFTVLAANNSAQNVYIQSATLNGNALRKPWLTRAQIMGGGELSLVMGPNPNLEWGSALEDRPPATMPASFHYADLPEPANDKPVVLKLPIRVVCGSDDPVGGFVPDPNMTEGSINRARVRIDRAADHAAPSGVYRCERYGNDFSYRFAVPQHQRYLVRLHFAEIFDSGNGARLENIDINGKAVLKDFDIFAAAGGKNTAVVKTFKDVAPDEKGDIVIRVSSAPGSRDKNAKICGIEILPPSYAAAEDAPPFTVKTSDGQVEISIDTSEAPEMQDWADRKLAPTLAAWYPKIADELASDGFTPPRKFSVKLAPGEGVAATSGARITGNAIWLGRETNSGGQALGAMVHEMVHVIQDYGWGRDHNPKATDTPGWLTEGIADYIRWFQFEPEKHGADQEWIRKQRHFEYKYDAGYRSTANFLNWVSETYDKNIVKELNAVLREGKYDDSIWKERTGKTKAELGAEWAKAAGQAADRHSTG